MKTKHIPSNTAIIYLPHDKFAHENLTTGEKSEPFDTEREAIEDAGGWSYDADEYEDAQFALAEFLECDPSELNEENYKHYDALAVYRHGSREYAIGTDSEADEAWNVSLDSYLDDCGVLDSIPENLRSYFDREKWKRDARYDGRGHSLSSYDGNEDEQDEFFIYRLN